MRLIGTTGSNPTVSNTRNAGVPFLSFLCCSRFADFMSRGNQARLPINNFPLAALKSLSCLYSRSCCFSWTSYIRASGKPELTTGTVFDRRQVDLIIHNSLYRPDFDLLRTRNSRVINPMVTALNVESFHKPSMTNRAKSSYLALWWV